MTKLSELTLGSAVSSDDIFLTTQAGASRKVTASMLKTWTSANPALSSPTLVNADLGTPLSGILTNCSGLPIDSGLLDINPQIPTFMITPSSANLRSAVVGTTGTGNLVFSEGATFVAPALGTPASGILTNCTGLAIATGLSGAGTGVLAALAVNVGSAGAFVVFGGALGTPSSGTLTSCTGLPISTGVSGLGTGVATALAVNTGSVGSVVVNGGALGTPLSGTLTNCTGLPVSTGISGLGTSVATALAVNVGSAGAFVVNGGALGTPSSGTLTSCTGLPISTGVSGLGANVATFLATPSSANLAAALTDETGAGAAVFAGSPTLTGSVSISGGTVTASTPPINATQTWNSGGVAFTGLFANITDTASDAASLLLDLQVGGASKFKVGKTGKVTLYDDLTIADAKNVILDATTGTKIGTATTQKLGFWNAAPVAQQSGTGETVGFTAGAGTNVTDQSTFTGNVGSAAYRISDVVKALKNIGILAS